MQPLIHYMHGRLRETEVSVSWYSTHSGVIRRWRRAVLSSHWHQIENRGRKEKQKSSNKDSGRHQRPADHGDMHVHHWLSIYRCTWPVRAREARRTEKGKNKRGQHRYQSEGRPNVGRSSEKYKTHSTSRCTVGQDPTGQNRPTWPLQYIQPLVKYTLPRQKRNSGVQGAHWGSLSHMHPWAREGDQTD